MPLLGVDLNEQMLIVNAVPMTSNCIQSVWNSSRILDVTDTPFLFSKSHNKFIVEGCGTAAISTHGSMLTRCSTICSKQNEQGFKRSYCNGVNCCQTNVPFYLDAYSVSVNVTSGDRCLSAFLVADNSYVDDLLSGQSVGDGSSVPLVLRWTLTDDDFSEVGCGYNLSRHELKRGSELTSVDTWKCSCFSELEEGNPYLSGGCKGTILLVILVLKMCNQHNCNGSGLTDQ